MTLFSTITVIVAILISLLTGIYSIRFVYRELADETVSDLKKGHDSKLTIISAIVLFVLFVVTDSILEDIPEGDYFSWNTESMKVFFIAMNAIILFLNITKALSVDMPSNIKRMLISGHIVTSCMMVALIVISYSTFLSNV